MSKIDIIRNTKKLLMHITNPKEYPLDELLLIKYKQLPLVLNGIDLESQRIIKYKYIDNEDMVFISINLNCSYRTVSRKLNNIIIQIGRILYGMESEWWDKFEYKL